MPVYDQVIGAHLDTSGVAPTDLERANQQFATVTDNDSDLAASDRERELTELMRIPGVRVELAIEGEERGRYLVIVGDGKRNYVGMTPSRERHRVEPPRGKPHVTVHAKPSYTAYDLREVLRGAAIDDVSAFDDDEIELPYYWHDHGGMMQALASIGPLLRDTKVELLADIDGRLYEVAIERSGITSRALHTIAESSNPAHASRFLELVGIAPVTSDEVVTIPTSKAKRPAAPKVPSHDPNQPLTTGSLRQREDAWFELTDWRKQDLKPDLAMVCAAVRDPANAGPRYAKLRNGIYHFLAKHDQPVVHETFLWALHEEDDEMAKTVTYVGWRLDGLIARLPELIAEAKTRGDQRTMNRMRRLRTEANP